MRSNVPDAYRKILPEHAKRLAAIVQIHGVTRAAKLLGCGTTTVEILTSGGQTRWDTVERIETRVKFWHLYCPHNYVLAGSKCGECGKDIAP